MEKLNLVVDFATTALLKNRPNLMLIMLLYENGPTHQSDVANKGIRGISGKMLQFMGFLSHEKKIYSLTDKGKELAEALINLMRVIEKYMP